MKVAENRLPHCKTTQCVPQELEAFSLRVSLLFTLKKNYFENNLTVSNNDNLRCCFDWKQQQ
jgi:hypothetical protein